MIDGQQRVTTFILLLKALLISINGALKAISSDDDSKSIKEALENRRKDILSCLYSIDEDDISMITSGSIPLSDLKTKYDNNSINEEYADDMTVILHEKTFEEIEHSVAKIRLEGYEPKQIQAARELLERALSMCERSITSANKISHGDQPLSPERFFQHTF